MPRKPIAVTFSGEVFYTQRDWDAYCKEQLKKLDEEEFGDFSEAELKELGSRVWEIPAKNLSYSGRRKV